MLKLIFFLTAAWLVYRLFRGMLVRRPKGPSAPAPPPRPEPRFRPEQVVDAEFREVDDDGAKRP